jgi:hypothetical protein
VVKKIGMSLKNNVKALIKQGMNASVDFEDSSGSSVCMLA